MIKSIFPEIISLLYSFTFDSNQKILYILKYFGYIIQCDEVNEFDFIKMRKHQLDGSKTLQKLIEIYIHESFHLLIKNWISFGSINVNESTSVDSPIFDLWLQKFKLCNYNFDVEHIDKTRMLSYIFAYSIIAKDYSSQDKIIKVDYILKK